MQDFIQIRNVSFSYPGFKESQKAALSHIDLNIQAGQFVALVGANGSGKSTLAKMLNALVLPDAGSIRVGGLDTREHTFHAEIRAQIGMVFQRPQDQIVATTVEEDVAFGPENMGIDPGEIRKRVGEALALTGLSKYRQRPSYLLSAGETQRLALAGVLAMRPRCIIFDETTAMLDPAGRDMVLEQIKALHRQGITIILITHLMQEAVEAERVLVLRQGQLVMDDSPRKVFSSGSPLKEFGLDLPPVVNAVGMLKKYIPSLPDNILTNEDLRGALPEYRGKMIRAGSIAASDGTGRQNQIEINDLSFTYLIDTPLAHRALEQINLHVARGHTHALIGGTGSGKSTILQHINALIRPQSGSVRVGHFNLNEKDLDAKALRRTTALAFQQPEDQIFKQYVGDEVAYAPRSLGYEGKLVDVVERAMRAVGLDFETYKDRLTSTLSGGEKRKVALASILAIRAENLLLDEPFSGLDPQSNKELVGYLKQMHKDGATLLISTHQYEELVNVLDEVSVIRTGRDVMHGQADEIFSQNVELELSGLKAPMAALVASQLRKKKWPIRQHCTSLQDLEKEMVRISGGKIK